MIAELIRLPILEIFVFRQFCHGTQKYVVRVKELNLTSLDSGHCPCYAFERGHSKVDSGSVMHWMS